jgi:lipoate-protein ligase A
MRYIKSSSVNPYFNLALEQFVFDKLDAAHDYFMLWQNHNSIIIGKYQNAVEEINAKFVQERGITVARRLSGGGAVYHDLGNLNFTFITAAEPQRESIAPQNTKRIDFAAFCQPIAEALRDLGAPVEISGRNDMTIEGKKFSGNAQYIKGNRVMHHGTLMFDSDLETVSRALNVSQDKIASKGVKSIKSRVTNIKPHIAHNISLAEFWLRIEQFMQERFGLEEFCLSTAQTMEVQSLCDTVYSTWDWNYGRSPAYTVKKTRRVEGCGTVQVFLDVQKDGVICGAEFHGDYFAAKDSNDLAKKLNGATLNEISLRAALKNTDIQQYFANLDADTFIVILCS